MDAFPHRHVLGIEDLSRADIEHILDTSNAFLEVSRRPVRKVPTLRGKTVINLFYENSTRTRTSFELAGKRMSADVINISVASSSVTKGETLYDTCKTLEAMHPDVIVMRHASSGAPHFVARHVRCSVINAGDGMHEHPTQALLDAFTIKQALGTLEGLTVAIVGDVLHSRVARSNALLLKHFGCTVRFVGPDTLVPPELGSATIRLRGPTRFIRRPPPAAPTIDATTSGSSAKPALSAPMPWASVAMVARKTTEPMPKPAPTVSV